MAIGYEGRLGGGIRGLGTVGVLAVLGGVGVGSLLHGIFTSKLAAIIASKSGSTPEEEYNKADFYISLIAAIPIGTFGALRMTKFDYESDLLDTIGCFAVGSGAYEFGNFTEVLGSLVKEL